MRPPHAYVLSFTARIFFALTSRTTSKKFHFDMRFLVAQNAGIFLAKEARISSMRLWSQTIVVARLVIVSFGNCLSKSCFEWGQVAERCESLKKPTTASNRRTEVREAHGMVG